MKRRFTFCLFIFLSLCLNAQESLNITFLSNWDPDTLPKSGGIHYNEVWGYTDCQENEYAIIGSAAYLHFFQIMNDNSLQEVDFFPGGNVTTWRDPKTYKDHCYSVCDGCSEGMMIFDLSYLPDSVVKVQQTTEYFQRSHNIYIDEENGKLYAVGTNTQGNGVFIFDLTEDPGHPTLWAQHTLPGGYMHDMYVRDNIGYGFSGNNGLWVYDFSDPDTAIVLGNLTQYPQKGYNHAGWLSEDGNNLVFADETHNRSLKMTDVSDLSDIQVTDLFRSKLLEPDTGSIAHNPFIRDNYVISSYYHDGFSIFDFSDPSNVQQVAWYDTEPNNTNYNGFRGCWGVYPFLPSERILVSDVQRGLFVFSADSINFEPIFPTTSPDASLDISGKIELCEGDSLSLMAKAGAEKYQWYLDGNLVSEGNQNLVIKELGTYQLIAKNDYCNAESEPIELSILTYPDATITAPSDLKICEGETVILSIQDQAEDYAWFYFDSVLEEGTDSVTISQSGEYYATARNGNCVSSSESIFLEVTQFPDDSLIISGNPDLCEGENIIISAFDQADNYEWYLNDSLIEEAGNSIITSITGDYHLVATNSDCMTTFETINVTVTEYPDGEVYINGEPVYCKGDSATIIFAIEGQASNYSWFLNDMILDDEEANTLLVPALGNYYGIASNMTPNGLSCADTSSLVEVAELSLPEIEIFVKDTLYCSGEEANIEATGGYENYVWFQNQIVVSDGDESGISVEDGGDFQVLVFDGQCSNISAIQKVLFFDPILPEIFADGDTLSSTPATEYHWLLNGFEILQASEQTYVATESGIYSIITIDENGCSAVSNEVEIIISSTQNTLLESQISIFPNPTSQNLFVKFSSQTAADYQLVIVNSIGQTMNKEPIQMRTNETYELNTTELVSGVYFLKIFDGEKQAIKRFVKH
jgi:choice-of-anchor B domain-containing protein